MPRPRNSVPTYRKHSSGCAAVTVYRPDGSRAEITLPGKFGSEESKREYESLLARLRGTDGNLPEDPRSRSGLTVGELVKRFLTHANEFYVHPGTKEHTGEMPVLRAAFRALLRLHFRLPAASFGPLALKALRVALVSGSWLTPEEKAQLVRDRRPIGLARKTVNHYVGRIKLLFTWGASEELVPASAAVALKSVAGLARGKSEARETAPVTPVSSAVIDDTLPHLPPVVRDMIEVLLLTGMRCGELCMMRARDLDMTGATWIYRPATHKNKHRGMTKAVAIGPRAQAIIRKYLKTDLSAYLFSPAEQDEVIRAAKRAARKTPLYPYHLKQRTGRRRQGGKRRPTARFRPSVVNNAIHCACRKAFPLPENLAPRTKSNGKRETAAQWKRRLTPKQLAAVRAWDKEHSWHTHQLRHSASLNFTREFGLEAARAALGHSTVDMSAMYAGRDLEAAKTVAAGVG